MNKNPMKSHGRISSSAMKKFSRARIAPARVTPTAKAQANGPLDAGLLRKMDAWWRAANYLSVGQTYLYDNPLLRQPLKKEHVKPRLVGHWGTSP
jgi:xylulose-5-phosphate/fructose-6-phosphate phosphoketolase